METENEHQYPSVRRYGEVFAKNSDGKYAVFFSDHQKDKDLFNDQATPWLNSMEEIFAWRNLFLFTPEAGRDETFAEWHKEYVFKKLSSDEISRLALLGRRITYNSITFDGSKPKPPTIGDLADREIVDYATIAVQLKDVEQSIKESTVE